MKFFRIFLPTIVLIILVGCTKDRLRDQEPPSPPVEQIDEWLRTLPGVHSVQELQATDYKKCYLIMFKQPLDHKNPAAGTFLQRVYLNHENFDNPMVIEAEGYNVVKVAQQEHNELTKRYKSNRVVVEHRYAGESNPSPRDWKYLTCENAAGDLHNVRVALGAAYTSSWIATGVSKGGSNTMSYMMYYPDDLAAAVAYVGPICDGVEDPRFPIFFMNVATPEMREKVENFQREVLRRRSVLKPYFFADEKSAKSPKEMMTSDQVYENGVVTIAQEIWQYGWPIDEVPTEDATDEEIVHYLKELLVFGPGIQSESRFLPMDDKGRSRNYLGYHYRWLGEEQFLGKTYSKEEASFDHYFVQVLIEFGGMALCVEHLEDLMPNHASWSENLISRFAVPADAANIQYSHVWNRKMNEWLKNSDPRLICVYGEYDPWTAAAPDNAYFSGKSNMAIFIEKGGSHRANIEKLSATDKQKAWSKLDTWVK